MAYDYDELFEKFKLKVADIIAKLKDGTYDVGVFSEFGARRRLSFEAQDYLIRSLVEANIPSFVGTSNVYLAKKRFFSLSQETRESICFWAGLSRRIITIC